MKLIRFLLIVVAFTILAGCSNNYSASYISLTGSKTWKVPTATGGTLHIEYKATITSGSLELLVFSPQGKAIWTVKGDTSGKEVQDIPTENGKYTIQLRGDSVRGNFSIKFSAK